MNFLLSIILYIRILDALSLLATCKTKQKINHKSQKTKNTYKQKYFLWLWKNVDVHASRFSAYQIFDVLSIFNLLFQVNFNKYYIINDDKSTLNENWILVYQRITWTDSSCLTNALCLLGRKYFIQTHRVSFLSQSWC